MPALFKVIRSSLFVIRKKHNELTTNDERRTTNKAGFTLLELMIAVSIIAIITAIGLVSFSQSQKLGRDAKRKQDLRTIAIALELYYQRNGRYPEAAAVCGAENTSTSSNPWINDAGGTPITPLNSTYVNSLPTDPINTSPNLYYYFGCAATFGNCSAGSTYILHTSLENSSDNDLYSKKQPSICGYSWPATPITWLFTSAEGAGGTAAKPQFVISP